MKLMNASQTAQDWADRVRRSGDCVHPYEDGEPSGYVSWFEWAKKHDRTHKHTPCLKCGLFVVCRRR